MAQKKEPPDFFSARSARLIFWGLLRQPITSLPTTPSNASSLLVAWMNTATAIPQVGCGCVTNPNGLTYFNGKREKKRRFEAINPRKSRILGVWTKPRSLPHISALLMVNFHKYPTSGFGICNNEFRQAIGTVSHNMARQPYYNHMKWGLHYCIIACYHSKNIFYLFARQLFQWRPLVIFWYPNILSQYHILNTIIVYYPN